MKDRQTVHDQLEDLRKERGLTLEELSKLTGISKTTLGDCEKKPDKDISHRHLLTLAKFYGVSMDYLFGLTENENHPNTALSELHLSDGVIELLKTSKINNRLLCEMITHEDFIKLMADIEIYVDGIAAMQIQNLNAWMNVAQTEIIKKYQPEKSDKTMHILDAAQIREGEYFSNRVHDDIDIIIDAIKDAHRSDRESAPENPVITEFKQGLEEVANFKGSKLEQLLILFCKQTQLKYNKLTDEEKQWLIRIIHKSEFNKGSISQKGKKKK